VQYLGYYVPDLAPWQAHLISLGVVAAVVVALYRDYGIRAVEIGSLMFGLDDPDTGQPVGPALELVRLAIPRRVYTEAQLAYVGRSVIEVHRKSRELRGFRITHGAPFLRHFTATLEELPPVPEPAGAAVLLPATVALFRRRR